MYDYSSFESVQLECIIDGDHPDGLVRCFRLPTHVCSIESGRIEVFHEELMPKSSDFRESVERFREKCLRKRSGP